MSSLCLNMIVKNEARVIRRCLASVRPFVSCWVIVDTGSTDGTQEILREALQGVPGELHERPWKNFEHNRNEALGLARGHAEFVLLIDADDLLVPDPGFRLPDLDADEVQLRVKTGDVSYYRTQIVRSSLPWRYVGVTHEVIECAVPHTTKRLEGLTLQTTEEGSRTTEGRKYREDVALLEEALKTEPDNARYVFYLAQSYRGLGELEKAIATYEKRAAMGGWAEEAWYALYQVAQLRERAGHDRAAVMEAYLRAFDYRPQRAEPLCELARYHRERGEFALAHLYASTALAIPRPADILFVQDSTYDWRCLDEYAVSAFYVGKIKESLDACNKLMGSGKLPVQERARVEANRSLCRKHLEATARAERNRKKRARRAR
jgi:tetratricopeptide (TPR) repeat protein